MIKKTKKKSSAVTALPVEKPAEAAAEVVEEMISSKDWKTLLMVLGIIILLTAVSFAGVWGYNKYKTASILSVDELHQKNLAGELDEDEGYVYNGYSFVKYDDFWNTEIKSSSTNQTYSMMFRFGPREVENISIEGSLNISLFNDATSYYGTFNPLGFGGDFSAVTLAVSDFHIGMTKVFQKTPIAACDRNETRACSTRPIVRCDTTQDLVFYVEENTKPRVIFDNNCIIVQGQGFDVVRAVDRTLFQLYGIQ